MVNVKWNQTYEILSKICTNRLVKLEKNGMSPNAAFGMVLSVPREDAEDQ